MYYLTMLWMKVQGESGKQSQTLMASTEQQKDLCRSNQHCTLLYILSAMDTNGTEKKKIKTPPLSILSSATPPLPLFTVYHNVCIVN